MRTIALLVAASVAWSSSALADGEAPATSLPPLPTGAPEAAPAPTQPAPTAAPPSAAPASAEAAEPRPATPPEPNDETLQPAPRRSVLTHRGFYLRVGSGLADVSVTGTGPGGSASVSGLGSSFDLAIGGSPSPGLAIGVVLQGAMATATFSGGPQVIATTTYPGASSLTTETLSGHAQATQALIGPFVDWFPNAQNGWHLGGSLGIGISAIRDDAYHDMTSVALGLGAAGGYDWWLAKAFSAGLNLFVLGALQAHASDTNGNDTGYRLGSATFGIGGQVLYY